MILKRFSQEADLASPEKVEYYLVIGKDDGSDFRLPVPKNTIDVLISEVYGKKTASELPETEDLPPPPEENDPPEVDEEDVPTTFGGEDFPEDFEQDPDVEQPPASEDDIPSL